MGYSQELPKPILEAEERKAQMRALYERQIKLAEQELEDLPADEQEARSLLENGLKELHAALEEIDRSPSPVAEELRARLEHVQAQLQEIEEKEGALPAEQDRTEAQRDLAKLYQRQRAGAEEEVVMLKEALVSLGV